MAAINFTDGEGAETLTNGYTAVGGGVGSRFRGWTPFIRPIGPRETSLGTGRTYQFEFRKDYGASFRLEEIPQSELGVAMRLVAWLLAGGEVEVVTGDVAARSYATCVCAPDAEPSLTMSNDRDIRYTLELTLINVATPPAAMLCEYPI
jgi:hypothetical protein